MHQLTDRAALGARLRGLSRPAERNGKVVTPSVQRYLAQAMSSTAARALAQRCGGETHAGANAGGGEKQSPSMQLQASPILGLQRMVGNKAVADLLSTRPVIQRACCVWKDNDCTKGKRKFNSMHNAINAGYRSASLNPEADPCVSGQKGMKAISEAECSKEGSC